MRLIGFLTAYTILYGINKHLKLTFMASKSRKLSNFMLSAMKAGHDAASEISEPEMRPQEIIINDG